MQSSADNDYIDGPESLLPVLDRWREADFLAIDTEFVREQTYYPQPCLVQVNDGRRCTCVDLLTIDPAQRLLDVLLMPGKTRVMHAASQDLEIFFQLSGRMPSPLFDTQIAAAMLGLGDQIGYAGLIKAMRGIELDKSLSRTNWAKRPLRPAEIAYAADDVRHLAEVYPEIRQRLEARGRLSWHAEDCAALADPKRYQPDPELAWKRLKGIARLERQGQHIAARLTRWRESQAIQRDRPRKWILADDAIYALAERHPRSVDELLQLKLLPDKTIERHADALLECVREGLEDPAPALSVDDRSDERKKRQMQSLSDALKKLAKPHELTPSLIASRADLDSFLRHGEEADIALLRGWRRELVGQAMLDARNKVVA